jgi:hypothetical protein
VVGGGQCGAGGDRCGVVPAGHGRHGGGDAVQCVRHRQPLRRRRCHCRHRGSICRGRRIGKTAEPKLSPSWVNPSILLRRICADLVGVLRACAGGGDEGRGRELSEVDGSPSSPSG